VFVIIIFVYILVLLFGDFAAVTSIRLVVMTVAEVLLSNPILQFGSCTLNMGLWQPPQTSFGVFQFTALVKEIAVVSNAFFQWIAWINRRGVVL
jgi:hypothetical protein